MKDIFFCTCVMQTCNLSPEGAQRGESSQCFWLYYRGAFTGRCKTQFYYSSGRSLSSFTVRLLELALCSHCWGLIVHFHCTVYLFCQISTSKCERCRLAIAIGLQSFQLHL